MDFAQTTVSRVTAESFCMAFLALRGQSAQAWATGRVGWMHLDLAQCTPSCDRTLAGGGVRGSMIRGEEP